LAKFSPDSPPKEGSLQFKAFTNPSISLPNGGEAIRGVEEEFSVNPVTGADSLSIQIPVPPCRSACAPQMPLAYNSASSNREFGLGWNLADPPITRKTDKGIPEYILPDEFD